MSNEQIYEGNQSRAGKGLLAARGNHAGRRSADKKRHAGLRKRMAPNTGRTIHHGGIVTVRA